MGCLELEYKPDAAQAVRRMEAWWEGEVLDRPAIQVCAPKPNPRPLPEKHHASLRERWMDVDYAVECADIRAANTYWGGEILPSYWPNLGPEILAASLGAELVFGENTSWSVPLLEDWEDIPNLAVNEDNPYLRTILDMTRRGLEVGRGRFIVGLTDLHPGGDLAASLRDPQQLCVDLVLEPERVHALMEQLRPAFYRFYELQHRILLEAGQTITTSWLPLFAEGRYYIPSCDFSCMISPEMFHAFFLEEIIEEIEWLDRSIYHLDGPAALRHLHLLLEIEPLDAVQFVFGAGNEPASKWMPVYRQIQAAGKNLHISIEPWEIDLFMEALRPEGVMLSTWARSVEEADALIAKVAKWTGCGRKQK
ncbi:MAG TPA: hypothetical protein VNJ09_10515 [Chthonomonadales bacterium]|nr:hypothetical protein [Chthonomonadales bacterium]